MYIKRKTKCRSNIGPLKNEAKETVADDQGMAELLNKFFGSVFTREDITIIPSADEIETDIMQEVEVTEKVVKNKIRNLKTASAAGPDGIGPRLLQELENELAPALTLIFRRSIEYGEIPEDWKTANVTPIYKKGAKADPGNYRPVSLTSVSCKILESIVKDTMMDHLLRKNLLSPSQHGFVPGRSCCTNLLEFLEKTTEVIDAGKPFDVVFLDFAKAFDKVPRERLLEKLRAHKIRGRTLNWIRNCMAHWEETACGTQREVFYVGRSPVWSPTGQCFGPNLIPDFHQ